MLSNSSSGCDTAGTAPHIKPELLGHISAAARPTVCASMTAVASSPPAPSSAGKRRFSVSSSKVRFNREAFDEAETYIVDANSVLFEALDVVSNRPTAELQEGVVEKLNALLDAGKQVFLFNKHPGQCRRTFAQRLIGRGLHLPSEENVLSVGHVCGLYLKSLNVRKPFVVSSQPGFMLDLLTSSAADCVATASPDGVLLEPYKRPATEQVVQEVLSQTSDVDAVVFAVDEDLTALKLALVAAYVQGKHLEDRGSEATAVPLVSCCPANARRRAQAMGRGAAASPAVRALFQNAPDDLLFANGIDVRLPSEVFLQVLCSSKEEGGFGVDPSKAVLIGDGPETHAKFARDFGMRSLIVINSLSVSSPSDAPPPDWVLPSFADA